MNKEMLQNNLYIIRIIIASLSINNNLNKIDKELLLTKLTQLENNVLLMIGD